MTKKRNNIADILAIKKSGKPITCLTAYTSPMAKILDKYVDILLVGDSLGMVIYGMESTIPVNLSMMINHGTAVVKASKKALVVVDMPFGSYQASKDQAFKNASRILKTTNCTAVKLEGGAEMSETIAHLTKNGIPVMGHLGLLPQSVNATSGYKIQGKNKVQIKDLVDSAQQLEKAGCFAVVVEGVKKEAADKITKVISIPTIGIGASVNCNGQVLVTEDLLGLTERPAKFVRKYADLNKDIDKAVKEFSSDVRDNKFPSDKECY